MTVPALALYGSKSPPWAKNACARIASVLAEASSAEVVGQEHAPEQQVLAPLLAEFFDPERRYYR